MDRSGAACTTSKQLSFRSLKFFLTLIHSLTSISYQDARSLILGAIDYAKNLDMKPYAEWNKVKVSIEGDQPYENKFFPKSRKRRQRCI